MRPTLNAISAIWQCGNAIKVLNSQFLNGTVTSIEQISCYTSFRAIQDSDKWKLDYPDFSLDCHMILQLIIKRTVCENRAQARCSCSKRQDRPASRGEGTMSYVHSCC